ncbi:MAG: iron-containing redox enzyme family protein [Gammaproteobacteria bacterium]
MSAALRDLHPDPLESGRSDREMFYCLLHPERHVDFVPRARERLRIAVSHCRASAPEDSGFLEGMLSCNANEVFSPGFIQNLAPEDCRTLIRDYAPSALLGQCWLANYSQAANCHEEVAAALCKVYQAYLDCNGRRSDTHAYKVLLARLGIDLPSIATRAFCGHAQISENAFQKALIGLSLARCAPDFRGELIGFTAGEVLLLSALFDPRLIERFQALGIPGDYHSMRTQTGQKARPALQKVLEAYLGGGRDLEDRKGAVERGLRLYLETDRLFWSNLMENLGSEPGAAERVLALFRRKARHARGFHRNIRVGGQGLDDWFAEDLADGAAFLEALADSEWFDVRNPERSRFFTRVTGPTGLMSGVFTPNELATIRDWLEERKGPERVLSGGNASKQPRVSGSLPSALLRADPFDNPKPGLREMFYRLVNLYDSPQILPVARDYVQKCLRYTRWVLRLRSTPELKSFEFSHAAFESRIDSIYRHQVDSYRPLHGKPRLNRDAWIWIIKQFAPTVLVDGCWLQNIQDPGMEHSAVADSLWKIYGDEVGNGETRFNHPLIYRRLLESLDINLQPIADRRFAYHADFLAGAFDIPVYLLAISRFPCSFLPELLGLNLAIELSGLGGGYLRLAESMEYWGIDSSIVRVHQAADNMAAGHSAIAMAAVGRYLDQIRFLSGEREMQDHWQRIWRGFASLRVVPLRFVANLTWHYLRHSGTRRKLA